MAFEGGPRSVGPWLGFLPGPALGALRGCFIFIAESTTLYSAIMVHLYHPHRRDNTKTYRAGTCYLDRAEVGVPRELRRRSDRGEWSSRCPPRLAGACPPHERRADAAGHEHIRKARPEHPGNLAGGPAAGDALAGRLAGVLRTRFESRLPCKSALASGGARRPVQRLD